MRQQMRPYPGLRPFERNESRIFFGRQQQVDELLSRLKQHHFLAVIGTSGSGKSSLIKAGLLPALAKGYMGEVGANWSIAEMRPGDQPFERLADALLVNETFADAWEASPFLAAELRRGARSLYTVLAQAPLPSGTRLLLVVDQFEEIFRYRLREEDQAAAFVALLLEACQHEDVYVVITMRSDFLGNAAEFPGLPEVINNGLYLTPRLSREQLGEAIRNPARLFGGKVDDALVSYLLNEAGNDPDQLPLLQHALMRLWEHDEDKVLLLEEYRELNGLRGALDGHAEQAWNELDAAEQSIAATVFCALTESSRDGQDIRRPVKVQELLDLTGADLPALTKIVDVFRQPGRNFLMPPQPVELIPATVLDISHESLIRQWQRLQTWVKEEGEKSSMYRRLLDAAQRHSSGKGELWHGTDLALAQDWQTKTKPNAMWARRYCHDAGSFELAMQFFAASETEQQKRQQTEENQRQRELKQVRRQFATVFTAFFIMAALVVWGLIERNQRTKAEVAAQVERTQRAEAETISKKNAEEEFYKKAIEADPKNPEKYMDYARFLKYARNDYDRAESYYEQAINADPKNGRTIRSFADFMVDTRKDNDKAEKLYQRAIDADPENADILWSFGDFLSETMKNNEKAEKIYQQATDADPRNAGSIGDFAVFMKNTRKNYDRSEKLYQQAIEADPKDARNLGNFALLMHTIRKNYDRAEKLYQQAIEADPKDANALGNFAWFMHTIRKDYDQAEKLYQQTIEIYPKDIRSIGNFAILMKNIRKDYDHAEKLYQQAIEADPKNADILGNFAWFMQSIRKDYDRAEKLYQQAIEADPKDANTRSIFASFLWVNRKDYSRAEKFYQDAIKIEPENPNALANFSQFRLMSGNYQEGKELINKSFANYTEAYAPSLKMELWFYRLAHFPKDYPQAKDEIVALLKTGERDEGWDFSGNIAQAEKDGHSNVALLKALSDVILDKAKFETLTPYLEK